MNPAQSAVNVVAANPIGRIVIRYGRLIQPEYADSDKLDEAKNALAARLRGLWNRGTYRSELADAAKKGGGLDVSDRLDPVDRDEIVVRHESGAIVIDYPRFHITTKDVGSIEGRPIVAICRGKRSIKAWGRASAGSPDGRAVAALPTEALSGASDRYRAAADIASMWALAALTAALHAERQTHHSRGTAEVSAIGVRDERMYPLFEEFEQGRIQPSEVLSKFADSEQVDGYLGVLAGERGLLGKGRQKYDHAKYFAVPGFAAGDDGYVNKRDTLFVFVGKGDESRILGVAYDDSRDGDLLMNATLEVARRIGSAV